MKRTNKGIEKELLKEKKMMKNRIKILLLGCGEAGKVIKAMVLERILSAKFGVEGEWRRAK